MDMSVFMNRRNRAFIRCREIIFLLNNNNSIDPMDSRFLSLFPSAPAIYVNSPRYWRQQKCYNFCRNQQLLQRTPKHLRKTAYVYNSRLIDTSKFANEMLHTSRHHINASFFAKLNSKTGPRVYVPYLLCKLEQVWRIACKLTNFSRATCQKASRQRWWRRRRRQRSRFRSISN